MFCEKCGNELLDEAVVCTKCGCLIKNSNIQTNKIEHKEIKGDSRVFFVWTAFVLAICAIFSSIAWLIYLISYYNDFAYAIYKLTWIFPSPSICVLLSIYSLKKKSNSISIFALILSSIALVIEFLASFAL